MMNRTLLKRIFLQVVFPLFLVCAGLVVVSGSTVNAQDQNAAQPTGSARTDEQIEMDVVHDLDASPALKGDLITAATIEGEVTLSGTVSSTVSKQIAESIASHVAGVTKVDNNLTVGNPQQAQEGNPGEQQMAENQPGNGPEGYPQQPPPPDQEQAPNYPPQPGYPAQPPPYGSQQPPAPRYETPTGPVTIPPGTLLQLRTSEPVSSKRAKVGEPVQFTVISDVAVGGVLAIPRGATVHGVITDVRKAGAVGGSPALALTLTSLDLGGQSYPLETDHFRVKGPNKAGHTFGNAFGGALLGAFIGGATHGPGGAAIGAGIGAGAGTAASAASPGPGIWIPAEALVDFHLKAPLTVTPVDAQEAARLAEGLYQGGPNLYRRGYYPYGSPYYPAYGYPPVYYHPYYISGGYYYWR